MLVELDYVLSKKVGDYPGEDSLWNILYDTVDDSELLKWSRYYAEKGVTIIDDLAEYLFGHSEIYFYNIAKTIEF